MTKEELLYAAVGVFNLYDKAVTTEDFVEARSMRLSVSHAIKNELGLLPQPPERKE